MKRDASKEKFWRGAIAKAGSRGKSVREYCRKKGLKENLFYSWRRKLKTRDAAAAEKGGFVELVRPAGSAEAGVSLRVDDRLSIVLERGFDGATLKAALAAVLGAAGQ
jgi:transposase-like protein